MRNTTRTTKTGKKSATKTSVGKKTAGKNSKLSQRNNTSGKSKVRSSR